MGLFEHFPYTNFHELNLDWLLQKVQKIEASLNRLWSEFLRSRVPTGGTTGQYLRKTSDEDYAMGWQDATGVMPSGGRANQVLTKNSSKEYDAVWRDPAPAKNGLPAGGNIGQVLKKTGAEDYAAAWEDESGGASDNYLPLAGGTMNEGAQINFTQPGGGHTELNAGILQHTGEDFQFVGQFNFQTECPSTQGTPTNPTDLATVDYVNQKAGEKGVPAGGTTGQVLKKISDADYAVAWENESGGAAGDYLPLAGGTMDDEAEISVPYGVNYNSLLNGLGLTIVDHSASGNTRTILQPNELSMCKAPGSTSESLMELTADRLEIGHPSLLENPVGVKITGPGAAYGQYARIQIVNTSEVPNLTDNDVVTKKYVDDAVAGGSSGGGGSNSKTWKFSSSLNSTTTLALEGWTDFMAGGNATVELVFRVGGGNVAVPAIGEAGNYSAAFTLNVIQSDGGIATAGTVTIDSTGAFTYSPLNTSIYVQDLFIRATKPDYSVN